VSDRAEGGAQSAEDPPLVAVVDDDPSVLRSLSSLLLSSGFRVKTFQSAESFLASGGPAGTSCLVLDLSMPGMTGAELISHLKATDRPVPFVVLTAIADSQETERMAQNGAATVLRKPASGQQLLRAVRSALSSAGEREK
jgi:FixJ family two-component response regulator